MPKIFPTPSPNGTNYARLFTFKLPHNMTPQRAQLALDAALRKRPVHDMSAAEMNRVSYEALEDFAYKYLPEGAERHAFLRHLENLLSPVEEVEVEGEGEDESEAEAAEHAAEGEEEREDDDDREDDEREDGEVDELDKTEMIVDAICRALGQDDESTRELVKSELLGRSERDARDRSPGRPPGSAERVGMKAALAADERRARIERRQRQAVDQAFPEGRRLTPRSARERLEVGVDPFGGGSAGADFTSLYDYFPDAERIG
jgi:hypothetical protein